MNTILFGAACLAALAGGVALWFQGVVSEHEQSRHLRPLYDEAERKRRAEQTARSTHEPT